MQILQQWAYQSKKIITLLITFALLLACSVVGQAIGIVQIVHLIFIEHAPFHTIFPFIALLICAITIRLTASYTLATLGGELAATVKHELRIQLLTKWTGAPFEQHVKRQTGEQVTLFIEAIETLESYYRDYVPQLIKSLFVPIAVLIAVFMTHPTSGWILLITAPFIPLTYILIGLQTEAKSTQQLEKMNQFSGKFLDLLQGLQTLKLFGQTKTQQAALEKSNAGFMRTTLAVLKIAFASTLFIELITTLGIGLVALEIGFQMIVFQTLAFAPAFLVLTLAPEYYNSLKELGSAFHTGRGSLAAAKLLQQTLEKQQPPVYWGRQPVSKKPSLSMEQALFCYTDGPQIGPFTFSIESGATVGMIGATGHGKTTLLHMLSGFAPLTEGQLFIDGKPQIAIDEQAWFHEMAYLSQQSYVFADTLRANICMGQQATDEEIWEVLQQAQLTNWTKQLTNGLETMLGEAGSNLSGGERQRIAIARALLKKPSIVFFDEPTAGLDVVTAQAILHTIRELSTCATTIIVTHRYETIAHANKILIIENGQLAMFGTHKEVANHPLYRTMKHRRDL